MVACDAFYGADCVSFNEEFAYSGDFYFGEAFAVEGCGFGFGECVVAVEAFVDLVVCVVFSSFDYVFFFLFEVVFAFGILTVDW